MRVKATAILTARAHYHMFVTMQSDKQQVAAYLGALHACDKLRTALIVAPATVLTHWVSELHTWSPHLRVVLLHRSAAAYNAAWTRSSSGTSSGLERYLLTFVCLMTVLVLILKCIVSLWLVQQQTDFCLARRVAHTVCQLRL
jgi:SNF2-related domain